MTIPDRILAALAPRDKGMDKRELARALGLKGAQKQDLKAALKALEKTGQIERRAQRKWVMAGSLPAVFVAEFFDRDLDGEMLARPLNWDSAAPPPLIVLAPGEAAGGKSGAAIGIGDKALIRVRRDEGGYEARIIKKLGQGLAKRILGVARKVRGGVEVELTAKKAHQPMSLRPQDCDKVEEGDLLVVAATRERRHGAHLVRLVERLGDATAPHAASMIALVENGIPQGFTDDELAQAEAGTEPQLGQRTDLRSLALVTIDPDDAKDFDDAIHARADEDAANPGGWVLTIAIADVAHFVPGGSALDRGAHKRGNSIYLPDRVVPMLPERLSNALCSLRAGEDSACMAVQIVIDAQGNKLSHHFMRALMRSTARLSYSQAQSAIDGKPDEVTKPILDSVLKPLWGAHKALNIARAKRAPLNIESDERKVRVDKTGHIVSITKVPRFDAHKLVEEFMIAANVCAAQTLEAKRTPLIYRVHEASSREKLDALSDFLRTIDIKWSKGERVTTKRFNELLAKTRNTKFASIINQMVLRTQMQAIYDTRNAGHFGLHLKSYAHFTSPIRRYADLTIHRALIRACGFGEGGANDGELSQLKGIAEDITATERRAMTAERDATDRYIASFLSERVGAVFPARIAGVTRFGLFLRLDETGADGFVPVRTLGHEFFVHDDKAHALIGRDSGGRYSLGQKVEARLEQATPLTGGLLFAMLSPPVPGTRPRGARAAPRRRRRRA